MTSVDDELRQLDEHGYVILRDLLSPADLDELRAALAPLEAACRMGRNDFEGERTIRVYSLANKGAPFLRAAEHPRLLALLDRVLLPNYLLSTFQSIRLHPGETPQPWHFDDAFYPIPRPRTRLAISTIWALEDFTRDNGATEIIPGSHRWGDERPEDRAHEVVPALMPAGSAIVFDGALWHRGGANPSTRTRLALSPQYCQPWLRPQESQLLVMPPERAAACSPRVRAMLGYSIHPPFMGQVEGLSPVRLVDPAYRSGRASDAAQTADRVLLRR